MTHDIEAMTARRIAHNRRMARPLYDAPLARLPSGQVIYQSDVHRVGRRFWATVKAALFVVAAIGLLVLGSFDGFAK